MTPNSGVKIYETDKLFNGAVKVIFFFFLFLFTIICRNYLLNSKLWWNHHKNYFFFSLLLLLPSPFSVLFSGCKCKFWTIFPFSFCSFFWSLRNFFAQRWGTLRYWCRVKKMRKVLNSVSLRIFWHFLDNDEFIFMRIADNLFNPFFFELSKCLIS